MTIVGHSPDHPLRPDRPVVKAHGDDHHGGEVTPPQGWAKLHRAGLTLSVDAFASQIMPIFHIPNMSKQATPRPATRMSCVDLFCGAGGLTRGLLDAGIPVVAGYDIDEACRYPYEHNNAPATFHSVNIKDVTGKQLAKHFAKETVRILVGCAPCVAFSRYSQGRHSRRSAKWSLLSQFGRLVRETKPDIVSIENVPELQRHSVFFRFLDTLDDEGFHFSDEAERRIVFCPDYGIPQHRRRLVLVASRLGPIDLIPPTHPRSKHRTVSDAIRALPRLRAGGRCKKDAMHCASSLSALNLRRIRESKPGGTWRDWPPSLVSKCHTQKTGSHYSGVYGRMEWDQPSPTITTQFHGFGNGRFGHPEQNRALSLREGAILQSFPQSYEFVEPDGKYYFSIIARMIGNAVPVRLGEIVGKTIGRHMEQHGV